MKKYSDEDIRKIISDVRTSASLLSKNPDRLCTSAEELIEYLTECKKYVIPENREEWCDLIRAIIYNVTPDIPPIKGQCANLTKSIENYDNMITNEILMYVYVAEIMASYEEEGLDSSIAVFNSKKLTNWARADIVYGILRFSMFGPEFVRVISPERIKKPNFKREYDKNSEYLEQRRKLESRLTFALKVKASLEEYKKYCVEYYCYECDNNEKKLAERKRLLACYSDKVLQEIVNNTYLFAKILIRFMKSENNIYQGKIFTYIPYSDSEYINLNCTGGYVADELYYVEYNGKLIFISDYLLKSILEGLSIEHDYDIEERIDGDIGCMYTYPKLVFNIELSKFNTYYEEFFDSKKRNINL